MKMNWGRYYRLARQGFSDYRWLIYYLQRITLDPKLRKQVAQAISRFLPKPESGERGRMSDGVARSLAEGGLVVLDEFVKEGQLQDILRYLKGKLCYDPSHPSQKGFAGPASAHRSCLHAYYAEEDRVATPHLFELANDPRVLRAVEQVLGCKPTISAVNIWWVLHTYDKTDKVNACFVRDSSIFHRDVDDWEQIKLYIYLTDVTRGSAPHAYVLGSHRPGILPAVRAVDVATPGFPHPDRLVCVTGKAGTAFLQNAFGMHRAFPPETGDRLIMTIAYTLFPLPFHRATARVRKERNRFDLYINRCFVTS